MMLGHGQESPYLHKVPPSAIFPHVHQHTDLSSCQSEQVVRNPNFLQVVWAVTPVSSNSTYVLVHTLLQLSHFPTRDSIDGFCAF